MEKLADSGMLSGVIDITTTEVCDLLLGGVLPATEDRFGAIARTKIPYVGSVGALDMVNFWAPETVPETVRGPAVLQHNPNVTLMRTTADECRAIGEWIGAKLNACDGPGAVSHPGKRRFCARHRRRRVLRPAADAALFSAIETTLTPRCQPQHLSLPLHINDPDSPRRRRCVSRNRQPEVGRCPAASTIHIEETLMPSHPRRKILEKFRT